MNQRILLLLLIIVLILRFFRKKREHYEIATDLDSKMLFDRLTADLSRLYPDISSLNLHAIVSCIPEDSFTEDKKHITICVRNKKGAFYPYSKLLKIGIHELAHAMSKQMDPEHKTPEFINNYGYLMNRAISLGYDVER